MHHSVFIHSSTVGHLSCFQVLAIVYNTAVNREVHVFFPVSVLTFLLYINVAHVAQLVGCHPTNQKFAGLIPSQDTCLGCMFGPQSGHMQEATDQCFSLTSVILFFYFSLLSPLCRISKRKKKFI